VHVAGLWRYPVKSLAGEALTVAHLTDNGIQGDRTVHIAGPHGVLTGRTRHRLLTIPAHHGPDGVPHVASHPWHSPEAAAIVRAAAGPDARLALHSGPERFDVLNLLVATDGAVAALGADVRRLRPNLLIGGVPADAERDWPGHTLAIGDTLVGVHAPRQRCVVTTIDPDSGEQDLDVLRRIRRRFGNAIALDCWVIRPGTVRLGDEVVLQPGNARPDHIGGWVLGARYLPAR
jgi:MOSC domain-containing protein